jgi:hypothetical protein
MVHALNLFIYLDTWGRWERPFNKQHIKMEKSTIVTFPNKKLRKKINKCVRKIGKYVHGHYQFWIIMLQKIDT